MGKLITNKIDLAAQPNPPVGSFLVAYDLDGVLKQKDDACSILPIVGSVPLFAADNVIKMNGAGTAYTAVPFDGYGVHTSGE